MPSELLPGGEPSGLLSGLVQGYTRAQAAHAQADLQSRTAQRDDMLKYLGMMVNNQEVAPEHRQWALQKIQEGLQHDISKKPWEVKFSELPPVTQKTPGAIQSQTLPGNTPPGAIQAPQPPPGVSSPTAAPSAAPGASGGVGRAANGTVNALGATPQGPTLPPPPPGQPLARQPIQMPIPPTGLLSQAPDTTREIASGGAAHLMTPEEKVAQAGALNEQQLNQVQQQFPTKTREELAFYLKHGEFPKPDATAEKLTVTKPGETVITNTGHVLYTNPNAPPDKPGDDFKQFYSQWLKDNKAQPSAKSELAARSAWNAANPIAQQRLVLDTSRLSDQEANALYAKTKGFQSVVDEADTAHNLQMQGDNGNSAADVSLTLTFFKVMKGEGSSGIRFTRQEQDYITGARSMWEGMEVKGDKVFSNGQSLTSAQRQRMVEVIDMQAKAAQRRIEEIQAGASKSAGGAGGKGGTVKTPQPPSTSAKSYTPPPNAPSMVGPDGHTIVVDGGQWVDAKTGVPIQAKK